MIRNLSDKRVILIIAIVVLLGIFSAYVVNATSGPQTTTIAVHNLLARMSLNELLGFSDDVIVGTVEHTQSYEAPSDIFPNENSIYTNVTIKISRYIYNPNNYTDTQITIRTLGGTVGSVNMYVDGGHAYAPGQRVLLFLKKSESGGFELAAYQGVFNVGANGSLGANDQERAILRDAIGTEKSTVEQLSKDIQAAHPVPPKGVK